MIVSDIRLPEASRAEARRALEKSTTSISG
jgi:hypothetical protein